MKCTCEQAAREATAPLLAAIAVKDTAIDTRDAYIGDLAARITERDATIADLRAEIERLRSVVTDHYNALCNRDATIADLRAQLARLTTGPVTAADVQRARERGGMGAFWPAAENAAAYWEINNPVAPVDGEPILPAMPNENDRVDAADVQREAEKWSPKRWFWARSGMMGSPTYADANEPILPAMTIPDDGRVDAGWPGADGGRDGA